MRQPESLRPIQRDKSDLHISRSTLALRLSHTRLTATLVDFIRIAEIRLVVTKALRAEVDTSVSIASLATPARAVGRSHSNGAKLGSLKDTDAAVIVATQGSESGVVSCRGGVRALE